MSLLADVRTEGLIHHLPPDVHSLAAADEAAELYEAYRHPLDEEQRRTIDGACAERADGTWAAAEVADFKSRQTGKGDSIECRELAGMELFGHMLVLHTAHEFPTANEAFLRMVSLYENYDDLRRRVARIRYANGEQGIEFLNGQRLKYKARTGGGGRGFAGADLVVLDEAQHLRLEHVAAIVPTTTANPNAQIYLAGSGGLEFSEVARRYRNRAISGRGGRLAYTERTAELVSGGRLIVPDIVDPLDHDLLMRAHPGYAAGRTTREDLETLLQALGFELFLRECLCVWAPEPSSASGPINADRWKQLAEVTDDDTSLATPESLSLGLSAPLGRDSACLVVSGVRASGAPHASIRRRIEADEIGRLVEIVKGYAEGHGVRVNVPPKDPALAWLDKLTDAGVDVHVVGSAEFVQAQQAIEQDVADGTLRHRGEIDLANAVSGLAARTAGDASPWSRRSSTSNVAPLMALAAARAGGRGEQRADPLSQIF